LIFALDSNVVIHAMKGAGRVAARLARMSPTEIAIPAVVVYELEFGTMRSNDPERRRKELERLLGAISILPFDDRAASLAAKLRYDLEQSGIAIGPIDTLIAGTVLAHGAKLISHNTREFAKVPGLQIEDWF
jgi:tRNA(fMet)-specific endonuclease VapC